MPITSASYLLSRLYELNVRHVFGVPGDYVLGFYDELVSSNIIHIGTTREDTAAFAADGYARVNGLGALAVTYGVGALSVVNAIAGASAESSPVIVISGAPGIQEQKQSSLLHHRFGPYNFQREIFERITCASAVLDDPFTAAREIDRTLQAALLNSSPVYIELPRDQINIPIVETPQLTYSIPSTDEENLQEAITETANLFRQARRPVIISGVETQRRGLQNLLVELIEHCKIPVSATLTGKSVVGERHDAYLGIYEGAMGSEVARDYVEASDFILMIGVTFNDVDLGIDTANLNPSCIVRAAHQTVYIQHHRYHDIQLDKFIEGLIQSLPETSDHWPYIPNTLPLENFPAQQPITVSRLISRLNQCLTEDMTVVADTGDCLFAALELQMHDRSSFLSSAFYTTMGFAIPAALGAQVAQPDRRLIILVGDGAFQMTGTELSTICRLKLNPVIIVFNNHGYSTERFILEGPFNDIADWQFHKLGDIFGPMQGHLVSTEPEFDNALQTSLQQTHMPSLINVQLRPDDTSSAMRRLASSLHQKVAG